ncbi:MAG TPA: GntR family transcriptional regulator [Bryobacteraceae bacterium]|jgi:DNA-binding GntR family transcriptional regulator
MSTSRLPVLKSEALRVRVAEAIRQALLEGRFKPGEDLSEVAIAKEMDVSRGPVREALLILAQQGLIAHSHNHGFSVLGFSDRDHAEIDAVRLQLESLALTSARTRITTDEVDLLEKATERLASVIRKNSSVEWVKAELEFHELLWELAGNRWLSDCLRRVMVPYFHYETAFRLEPQITDQQFADPHQIYVDFLKGSSQYSAEECVRIHLGLSSGLATRSSPDLEAVVS